MLCGRDSRRRQTVQTIVQTKREGRVGGRLLLATPTVGSPDVLARPSAESPRQPESEPIAFDRSDSEIAELLGVAEHAARHQVHIDPRQDIHDADASGDPMRTRDREQSLGIPHARPRSHGNAADAQVGCSVDRVLGPRLTGSQTQPSQAVLPADLDHPLVVVILDKQTFYRYVAATYEGIKPIDLVPNLSPQNLVSVEIGKDFMRSHGYIKNDFDVRAWAAPEFLEQAAKELREQQWKKATAAKLPDATELLASSPRVG